MSGPSRRLLHVRRLCAAATAHPTVDHGWRLHQLVLGDTREAWESAGFCTVQEQCMADGHRLQQGGRIVRIGDGLTVRLTGEGGGLRDLVFSVPHGVETSSIPLRLPGVGATARAAAPAIPAPAHPNTVLSMGEVVLYAQHLQAFVDGMAAAGVATQDGRPSKPLPGGTHAIARFMFGGTRLLVCGPTDPAAESANNPPMWMFGRGEGAGSTELTGLLPVAGSLCALRELCPEVGEAKDAVQEDRQIATLKEGAISNLTGTLAFLSDGTGALF